MTSQDVAQFQKDILVDGIIDDAEMSEAHNRFEACFEDLGYEVTIVPGVSYTWSDGGTGDPSAVVEAAYQGCQTQFIGMVEPFYLGIKTNPDNVEWRLHILTCLRRHGLVDPTYTVEQVEANLGSINPNGSHDCVSNPNE